GPGRRPVPGAAVRGDRDRARRDRGRGRRGADRQRPRHRHRDARSDRRLAGRRVRPAARRALLTRPAAPRSPTSRLRSPSRARPRGNLAPMSTTADSSSPAADETRTGLPPTTSQRLTGWGRTAGTTAQVLRTEDPEVIAAAVAEAAERADGAPAHLKRGVI